LYKDTERIGRDLNKLIMLDSSNNTIMGQSNNTIMIPAWRGNKNDTILAELCPILAAIAIKNLDCKQATMKIH
jgi:TFIIF-interacting CTD phosphatase-like protein